MKGMSSDYLVNQMKPLANSLRVFGLAMPTSNRPQYMKEQSSCSMPTLRTVILWVFINAYGAHSFANFIIYVMQDDYPGKKSTFSRMAPLIQSAFSVIALNLFIFRRHKIYQLYDEIFSMDVVGSTLSKREEIAQTGLTVGLIWLAFVLHVVPATVALEAVGIHEYIADSLYNSTYLHESSLLASRAVCLMDLMCFYVIALMSYLVQALTVYTVLSLFRKMTYMQNSLGSKIDVFQLTPTHTTMVDCTLRLDTETNIMFGLWLTCWMIGFLTNVPMMYKRNQQGEYVEVIYYGVTEAIFIVVSSFVSSSYAKISAAQGDLINAVQLRIIEEEKVSAEKQIETKFLLCKINSGALALSVVGYCSITKGLLLNLYGFVTTFVIFTIQEMDKNSTLANATKASS